MECGNNIEYGGVLMQSLVDPEDNKLCRSLYRLSFHFHLK